MASKNSTGTGTVYLDTSSAQSALDKLNSKIKEYDNLLEKGNSTAARRLTIEGDRAKAAERAASIQQQIEKGLGATYNQQTKYVTELTRQLKNLSVNSEEYKQKLLQLRQANGVLDGMKQRINGIEEAQEKMGNSFTRAFSRIANYAAAYLAFDQITSFLSDAVSEAEAAEKALSRLQNTLLNMGRSDSFDRIISKADELADTFKFLDNDDITEVFQQLIIYGKLTENQMNALLPVIINFSAKSGISINDGASVIIKAMEGNARALKEFGISIKDGGDVTERFGIIMSELKPKVEGAAEAFGETFAGQTATARQEVANLKEEVGAKLLPVLKFFYSSVSDTVDGLISIFTTVKTSITDAISGIKLATVVLKDFVTLQAFKPGQIRGRVDDYLTEINAIDRVKHAEADRLQIQQAVNSVVKEAGTLSLKEQQALLKQNIALKEQSFKTYNELVTAGKKGTEEYRQAAVRLATDAAIVTGLQKSIAQARDNRTFGGDASGDTKPDKAAESAKKRAMEASKKLLEEFNNFISSLNISIQKAMTPDSLQKAMAITREYEADLAKLDKLNVGRTEREKALTLILQKKTLAFQQLFKEESNYKKIDDKPTVTLDLSTLGGPVAFPLQLLPEIPEEDIEATKIILNGVITRLKEEQAAIFDPFDPEKMQEYLSKVTTIINETFNVLGSLNQARANRENAAFNRETKQNDERKKQIQRLADTHVLSEKEAARQIAAIDAEQEKKKEELDKKQFERNKRLQIAQAAINGALAVTNIWATTPKADFGVTTILLLAASAAATLASISQIASTKYAKGGRLTGPSHDNGGMPVINPRTGRKEAEVEGGEYILSKHTVRNNRELADALLFSSMNKGGARIKPFWQTRPFQTLDFPRIVNAIQQTRYASGGVFGQASGNGQLATDPAMAQALEQSQSVNLALLNSLDSLNAQLAAGIRASVSQMQIDQAAQKKQRRIEIGGFR